MGVVEAEVGYPTIPEHVEFVKLLKRQGSRLKLGMHTRYYDPDYRNEIAKTVEAGTDLVNLVGYWGYIMTDALCPQNWKGNIQERVGDAVGYAHSLGATVAVAPDTPPPDFIARLLPAA